MSQRRQSQCRIKVMIIVSVFGRTFFLHPMADSTGMAVTSSPSPWPVGYFGCFCVVVVVGWSFNTRDFPPLVRFKPMSLALSHDWSTMDSVHVT